MRILAVGNMYPPHHFGGYELVWQSAVRHLRAAGSEVRVLTTDFRLAGHEDLAEEDPEVHRTLRWYWRDHEWPRFSPLERLALERHNAQEFDRHRRELAPDVVTWWAMGGMSLSLVERARRAGLPAVAVAHDHWLIYASRVDAWMRMFGRRRRASRIVERLTGIPTRFDPSGIDLALFVSETIRAQARAEGRGAADSAIAHSGIDPSFLAPAAPHPWRWQLLYVGRIDDRKGIGTAVEALALLPDEARLTVVGDGNPAEVTGLHARIRGLGVESRVTFTGPLARAELPGRYAECDAVVFPVVWDEPWGLVPLEGMALGRPVAATGRGGSGEYLRDGENCLLFTAGDAAALADAVRRLADDPPLRDHLREGGRRTAAQHTEDRFNRELATAIERTVQQHGR